jgi:hypothetical protein
MKKPIPQFSTEDEERNFWATADSTEYLDWAEGAMKTRFIHLKPSLKAISPRPPVSRPGIDD